MNQGMFSEIKALVNELTKRLDKLIELVESQVTQSSTPEAPAPVEAELPTSFGLQAEGMTHDGERTIVKAPAYTPTYAPAHERQVAAPAKPYFDRSPSAPKVKK